MSMPSNFIQRSMWPLWCRPCSKNFAWIPLSCAGNNYRAAAVSENSTQAFSRPCRISKANNSSNHGKRLHYHLGYKPLARASTTTDLRLGHPVGSPKECVESLIVSEDKTLMDIQVIILAVAVYNAQLKHACFLVEARDNFRAVPYSPCCWHRLLFLRRKMAPVRVLCDLIRVCDLGARWSWLCLVCDRRQIHDEWCWSSL
jgi:hypothetical protein